MKLHRFHSALIFALLLAGCASGYRWNGRSYPRHAYLAGKADAERNLDRGILATEAGGVPFTWSASWTEILHEHYDIEVRWLGCIATPQSRGHQKGYNAIAHAEIERRFGTNIWQQSETDAHSLYDAARPASAKDFMTTQP